MTSQTAIAKVIENLRAVDQYRTLLDQQRFNLELCRYEIDILGGQLSNLLYNMTHPTPSTSENAE